MASRNDITNHSAIKVIYDGDCPFCRQYVKLIRIKEDCGKIRLINAREQHREVLDLIQQGYNLDRGMVAIIGDAIYQGEDVLNQLALLSTQSSLFNKFNYLIFRHPCMAQCLYPLLRLSRNLVLKLLGKKKIHAEKDDIKPLPKA